MTDRRAWDPWAPPAPSAPAEDDSVGGALTGVVQPPVVEAPDGDAVTAAGLLPDDLDDITKPDLIALAEMAGVATYGTKAEIAARIREAAGG